MWVQSSFHLWRNIGAISPTLSSQVPTVGSTDIESAKSGLSRLIFIYCQIKEICNLLCHLRDSAGELTALPRQHIGGHACLERLVAVAQNRSSNYDTDFFAPLLDFITEVCQSAIWQTLIDFQLDILTAVERLLIPVYPKYMVYCLPSIYWFWFTLNLMSSHAPCSCWDWVEFKLAGV